MIESADFPRALHVLVHDLRTPLGVATGYLRLLRDGRLPLGDQDRAFVGAIDALRRMAGLCDEASAFEALADHDQSASAVEVKDTIEKAAAMLQAAKVQVESRVDTSGCVRLTNPDAVLSALGRLLQQGYKGRLDGSAGVVQIVADDQGLHFVAGAMSGRTELLARRTASPYDPWDGAIGLAMPLACRVIEASGGKVTATTDRTAVAVQFPIEHPTA